MTEPPPPMSASEADVVAPSDLVQCDIDYDGIVSFNLTDVEVEILDGLTQGDSVVVSGQFLIDSEANLQASFMRLNRPDE